MPIDQDTQPDEPYYITDGFPIEASFPCWDESLRAFTITCQKFPEHGFVVEAREKDNPETGYAFAAPDDGNARGLAV